MRETSENAVLFAALRERARPLARWCQNTGLAWEAGAPLRRRVADSRSQ